MASTQLSFPCKGRGGWRPNAGRPNGKRISRHAREEVDPRHPVHLVWRANDDVPSMRGNRLYDVVVEALRRRSERAGFRVVYACVLGNHLHLLGECDSVAALGRGMAALGTSVAMRVNRATDHRGAVFEDRYFVRSLGTPTEVARAMNYVIDNARHHGIEVREPLRFAAPRTWLLREGWRRGVSDVGQLEGLLKSIRGDREGGGRPS